MSSTTLPAPALAAVKSFAEVFHDEIVYDGPLGAAWAPGRINLIGEHTDYNDGFVLPLAVDRVVALAGRMRSDKQVRLWSTHFQAYAQFPLQDLPEHFEQRRAALPIWARYVLGVMSELQQAGIAIEGFDAVIDADVPLGGGMSSSAALEVATAHACALFSRGQFTLSPVGSTLSSLEVAALCQRAEHRACGLKSGILDQAASCLGQAGKAILLDCRSLAYRYLAFEDPTISIIVIDSVVRRELATSAYNERQQQCADATRILRELLLQHEPHSPQIHEIRALRDITPEQLARYQHKLPEVLRKRASYILAENARVLVVAQLLEQGDLAAVGPLLWLGHAGLRDEYQVSCEELDLLVDIARQVPGVLGGRMMGGGFGGCTVNLVRSEAIGALSRAVAEQYPARTGHQATIALLRAAGGPRYIVVE
jgi:galactokinase